MRRPETPLEHGAFKQAWSEVLGREQTHIVLSDPGRKDLYAYENKARIKTPVFEQVDEGMCNGEIELPVAMARDHEPMYIGFLWLESQTFEAYPWHPLSAWLREVFKTNKWKREFAVRDYGDGEKVIVLPMRLAREVTLCQMRLGPDEHGELPKRGLRALERSWAKA